jgi:serine/threonine protein kinase
MTPKRHHKAGNLYHAVLEMAPEARAAFLDEACGADDELRREAESLLRAHDRVGNYFAAPALDVAARLLAARQNLSLAGQGLSHYRVLSLIGAGGMGEVYLAEDTHLGRKVALKLLPREFTGDPERVRRFELEARSASSLNHPNIMTIFEVGQVDGRHFIATEYIDGQTLRERLSATPLEVDEALDVAAQIASALEAAHAAGIVHRDIKPENVILRRDGLVKVLDFGLAKLTETGSHGADSDAPIEESAESTPGLVLGTVSYMSPEQARGLKVDARSDNFSLGVVVYEMLAGRCAFEGATPSDVMAAILQSEPLPLARFAQNVPAELERIVAKALCKDKEERYQTASELSGDIKSLKQELEVEARLTRSLQLDTDSGRVTTKSDGEAAVETIYQVTATTGDVATRTTSSVDYLVREIKRHKRGAVLAAAAVVVVIAAIAYFFYPTSRVGEAIDSLAPTPAPNPSRKGSAMASLTASHGCPT